jgi:hypothetical protein
MVYKKLVISGFVYYNVRADDLLKKGVSDNDIRIAAIPSLCDSVDQAAGKARSAFVSPGSYIDQEYLLAKQEAQAWLDGGKDLNAIPSSVEDHMAMFDVDAETAAQEIVATAAQWEQALTQIRRARLGGKAAVRNAETIEAKEAAAADAIATLNDIRPQEGAR